MRGELMQDYPSIRLEELTRLARGDNQFIVRMLNAFLQNTPDLANQLETAARQNDRKTISAAAHRMAPAFAYVGREDISRLLKSIEEDAASQDSDLLLARCLDLVSISQTIIRDVKNAATDFNRP